ncbi:MAG TPA: hypothetical protein VJO32_03035 [Ktedonobacteraceae bacterium]|nr:hypothetical protein [Ktedonobacteraceae bacterium]
MKVIAIALGVLGSIIAIYSAITAFAIAGGDPAYSSRLWADWLALILAAFAGILALFMIARPVPAGLIMLISGITGFISINLFYINTLYGLAVPLWFIAAIIAWIATRSRVTGAIRGGK